MVVAEGLRKPTTKDGEITLLAPSPLLRKEKVMSREKWGDVRPLVIDMDAAQKSVNCHW